VTTSSDRLLLRWVPLAALLAAAMAVGLSVGPHPFGFHGWPKAPAPRSIERVVRVVPKASPVAIARREPAARSQPAQRAQVERSDDVSPIRNGRPERATRAPRHATSGGHRSGPSVAPVQAPAPPSTDGGDGHGGETPGGTPIAQGPDRVRHAAKAKRQVGHGQGHHGQGHHGRHGHR
jgi:hypothetical protein